MLLSWTDIINTETYKKADTSKKEKYANDYFSELKNANLIKKEEYSAIKERIWKEGGLSLSAPVGQKFIKEITTGWGEQTAPIKKILFPEKVEPRGVEKGLETLKDLPRGVGIAAFNFLSGIGSLIPQAALGLGGIVETAFRRRKPETSGRLINQFRETWQKYLTIQPKTETEKAISDGVNYAFSYIPFVAQKAGEGIRQEIFNKYPENIKLANAVGAITGAVVEVGGNIALFKGIGKVKSALIKPKTVITPDLIKKVLAKDVDKNLAAMRPFIEKEVKILAEKSSSVSKEIFHNTKRNPIKPFLDDNGKAYIPTGSTIGDIPVESVLQGILNGDPTTLPVIREMVSKFGTEATVNFLNSDGGLYTKAFEGNTIKQFEALKPKLMSTLRGDFSTTALELSKGLVKVYNKTGQVYSTIDGIDINTGYGIDTIAKISFENNKISPVQLQDFLNKNIEIIKNQPIIIEMSRQAKGGTVINLRKFSYDLDSAIKSAAQKDMPMVLDLKTKSAMTISENNPIYQQVIKQRKMIQNAVETPKEGVRAYEQGMAKMVEEGMTYPAIHPAYLDQIVMEVRNLIKDKKVQRTATTQISEDIINWMQDGKFSPEFYTHLKEHGVSAVELGQQLFRTHKTVDFGKFGQKLSTLEKLFKKEKLTSAEADLVGGWQMMPMPRRIFNIGRGLSVSQVWTHVRNAVTQGAVVTLKTMTEPLEWGYQQAYTKITGRPVEVPVVHPFGHAMWLIKNAKLFMKHPAKKLYLDILNEFPSYKERLLHQYSQDVVMNQGKALTEGGRLYQAADKVLTKAEKAVYLLNTTNRMQETLFRRISFEAKLDQLLRDKGISLEKLQAENKLHTIPESFIEQATNHAFEMTFAETPKTGTLAYHLVKAADHPLFWTTFPFPRFLYNSLKFTYDYTPLSTFKLISKKTWADMAKGDMNAMSRTIVGSGMLYLAWKLRNSKLAGEKFYELKTDEKGTITRLQSYYPLTASLFMAETIKKYKEGRLDDILRNTKDLVYGLAAVQGRAGLSAYLIDEFAQVLSGKSPDKLATIIKRGTGEIAMAFFTPLRQLSDVVSVWDEEEAKLREKRLDPFWGGIKSSIPYVSQTLPEMESPTRAETPKRIPLITTGGLSQREPKNIFEQELDRLGFRGVDIFPRSGNDNFDYVINKHMGELVSKQGIPALQSEVYKKLSDSKKSLVLNEILNRLQKKAAKLATEEAPELAKKASLSRVPRREKKIIQELKTDLFE